MANSDSYHGAETRIRNYTNSIIPERVKEDFEARREGMLHNLGVWIARRAQIDGVVRGVLAGTSEKTVDYPKYFAFALEVASKLHRLGGGTGLIEEVALTIAKWQARGCTRTVLEDIRDAVFAIAPPSAP